MKQGKFFVTGMLALVLALGLVLAGCDNGTNSGGGGTSLDKALIAKWYIYPTQVDDPSEEPAFEITATGRLIGSAVNENAEITITTSGKTIKSTTTFNGDTVESGTATYSVTGNRLLLSNPMINGVTGGLFVSFVSAIQAAEQIGAALGADGHYHKSGTGTGNTDPKTLVINNVSQELYDAGASGIRIGIFPTGISPQQALHETGIVAGADGDAITPSGSSAPYTVTASLYVVGGANSRWTGSGTYDIYLALGSSYYRKQNVAFNSAKTTVSATEFSPVNP